MENIFHYMTHSTVCMMGDEMKVWFPTVCSQIKELNKDKSVL